MASRLNNCEPAAVAKRALDTYRDLLAKGHTDAYSRALAIGTCVAEAEDVRARTEVDFAPPNRTAYEDREVGHGGFAPGSKGWEER